MDQDLLKTNLLSIAVAGLLMLLAGTLLYFFRDEVSNNVRFFMPIPPLIVAAYIFVFNMYNYYDGNLPGGAWTTSKEIIYSAAISAVVFGISTLMLIVIIHFLKR
jgi:hypothetical protein